MSKTNASINYLSPKESEEQLKPEALNLLDHIAEILAEEYVQVMKANAMKDTDAIQEEKREEKGGKER